MYTPPVPGTAEEAAALAAADAAVAAAAAAAVDGADPANVNGMLACPIEIIAWKTVRCSV
jgi:hypothetical protein